jgi:hypothetical protein
MRPTSNPTGLYGAVIIPTDSPNHPAGGRYVEPDPTVSKRVPVRLSGHPRDDRYVSLTTHRIHATTVYVVAEIDSTGRMTDPRRFSAHTTLTSARKAANRLLSSWGGVAQREEPAPTVESKPRSVRPRQLANGRWRASIRRNGRQYVRMFDTEREAEHFISQVTEEARP